MNKDSCTVTYTKLIACLFFVAFCVAFRQSILHAILPFALSFLLSLPVQRLSEKISSKTKIHKGFCAGVLLVLLIVGLFFIIRMGMIKLFNEIKLLAGMINEDPELITNVFNSAREKLSAGGIFSGLLKNPELEFLSQTIENAISSAFERIISGILQKMSDGAVLIAQKIPSVILFFSVFFISAFYFCCDNGRIKNFLLSVLPHDSNKKVSAIFKKTQKICISYISASLTLGLVSFVILFVGLSIIGSKYALFSALLIAVVDLLPVFGASCVLLPWSIICFISSDSKTGVGLLIICVILVIFRQIAEPKVIGKNIGLHPLATLCSVYMGMQLLGSWGLLLGPVIAVGIKGILDAKSIDKKGLL